MRENMITRLLAVFVVSLLAALPLAGCGSTAAVFTDPAALFQQAREEVGAADSFRESGDMVVSMDLGSGEIEMTVGIDAVFERQDDGEWIAQMDMSMDLGEMMGEMGSGPGSKMKVRAYVAGGKMYMNMSGTGMWFYQERDELQDMSGMNNGVSPEGLSRMLEAAKETEVLEDGPYTVKYRVVPDVDKVYTPEVEEKIRQSFVDRGRTPDYVNEILQNVKAIFSDMEMTVTADKRTGQVVGMTMLMEDFMGSFGGLLPGSGSSLEGTGGSLYVDFTFSDYGKDFGIELPEEALDALPMEEMLEEQLK
jgi:hypothetical protein